MTSIFMNYRLDVLCTHTATGTQFRVPGVYAGNVSTQTYHYKCCLLIVADCEKLVHFKTMHDRSSFYFCYHNIVAAFLYCIMRLKYSGTKTGENRVKRGRRVHGSARHFGVKKVVPAQINRLALALLELLDNLASV